MTLNKILSNNTLLKVISVIIAIVMWAYIVIVIDAPTEKTFRDVTIDTLNQQVFTNSGYCIEKLSVSTASVKIEGSRRVISKFDSSNISAVLDFSEVSTEKLLSEGAVTVNLKVESEFGEIVSYTPSTVDVYIETTKYKDISVDYTTSGDLLSGYECGDIRLSNDSIRIFGAQQNIENVEHASINIDLINTDYSAYTKGELNQECTVRLYDGSGKELSAKDSRWIWNNTPTVTASFPLYKVKTVPIVVNSDSSLTGMSVSSEPKTVSIYGDNELVDECTSILTKAVTSSDFVNDDEITVKLVLPDWAKTVDDVTEVKVSAYNNQ